ncbi:unnamed protein product [Discosporangium mesarthrocarpum]
MTHGVCTGLLEQCAGQLRCIVLPAFEVMDNVAEDFVVGGAASKKGLVQAWEQGRVVPFASQVWPPGHRATNFERWKNAWGAFEVPYEEGFEPFVVMHRGLVPIFDERFEGYGRNKVIFFFHLYALGFRFTVHPDLYLVHFPHAKSESWRRTFEDGQGRLADILALYAHARAEIVSELTLKAPPPTGGLGLGKGWGGGKKRCRKYGPTRGLGYWSEEGQRRLRSLSGTDDGQPKGVRQALLANMHVVWFKYEPKPVKVIHRWGEGGTGSAGGSENALVIVDACCIVSGNKWGVFMESFTCRSFTPLQRLEAKSLRPLAIASQ